MKIFEKSEIWFAVALIVFFFLPWVSIAGLFNSSGYQVPDLANLMQAGAGFLQPGSSQTSPTAYLVYLVPVLGAATIAMAATGRDTKIVGLITGGVAILIIVLLWSGVIVNRSALGTQSQLFSLGIGAYLTALAGIGMILVSLGVLRPPQRTTA